MPWFKVHIPAKVQVVHCIDILVISIHFMLSFYAQPYVVMCTTSVSLYTHHLLSSLQASDKVSCCLWNLIPNKHVSFQLTATVLVCFHIITNSVWQITQSKPHYMWQLFRVFSHWWGWGSKILKRIPRLQWIFDKVEIQAWLSASTPITIMPERTFVLDPAVQRCFSMRQTPSFGFHTR